MKDPANEMALLNLLAEIRDEIKEIRTFFTMVFWGALIALIIDWITSWEIW